jgi:DNA invertase Pin-like site-specific DNA recombinase
MLPTDNKNGGLFIGSKDNDNRRRAAIYVRASSEHQQYSTRNQTDAIIAYADTKGFEVVRTYSDDGKSGLDIEGRKGLQQLIADVQEQKADFDVVLVYDISRWGRFQDNDAGAYYEYACRQSGIDVHYVIGHLKNDGSITDSILKAVDRYSAGNYSYTLSIKVHLGSTRLIRLGYRQGGTAGFGLRRVMIDERGEPKMELKHGERKSLQTDRVILVPGPKEEVEHVRWIYKKFVDDKWSETQIAAQLNTQGVKTDLGKDWTQATVRTVLTNEKYIGNNVYNRQSFKLKRKRVKNPPEEWVRKDNAFEAIVEPAYYLRPNFTIAVRMDAENKEPMDYYVLPAIDVENPQLRLAQENGFALDAYRFDSLEPFYQLAERTALPDAA